MSSVKAYLELARWPNALMAAAGVLVGAQYGTLASTYPKDRVLSAALAAIALTITANAWNDAADAEIDAHAHPARPIPSGALTPRAARSVALVAASVALVLAFASTSRLGVVTVPVVALMLAYSPWLKRAGLVGNITVAVLASLPFLYGAWATGHIHAGVLLVAYAAPFHLARELSKDIEDAPADANHRRTVPLRFGDRVARRSVVLLLTLYLGPLFVLAWEDPWGVVIFLPAVILMGVAGVRILRGRAGAPTVLKAAMFFAMVALFIQFSAPAALS